MNTIREKLHKIILLIREKEKEQKQLRLLAVALHVVEERKTVSYGSYFKVHHENRWCMCEVSQNVITVKDYKTDEVHWQLSLTEAYKLLRDKVL